MNGYTVHIVVTEASIGGKVMFLLFAWLISGAAGSWMSERKGYGERVGLTLGLLLSVVGLLIVLLLPGRPGSKWRVQGWRPRRRLRFEAAEPWHPSERANPSGGGDPTDRAQGGSAQSWDPGRSSSEAPPLMR